MKWNAFIRDLKEKVGLSPSQPSTPVSGATGTQLRRTASAEWTDALAALAAASAAREDEIVALRDKYYPPDPPPDGPIQRETEELEVDFKRAWDCFLASASQKEKSEALTITVDIFCRLVKREVNATQLLTRLAEARVFSFVVARALVTDVEKLRISNKEKTVFAGKAMIFFLEMNNDGIIPGSNLLYAVQVLSFEPIDKQPLFSSGLLCCFIHLFDALVNLVDANAIQYSMKVEELASSVMTFSVVNVPVEHLEVKETIVHITKALASHPSAARSLLEDDSLELLFRLVSTGSLVAFSLFKQGLVPLHSIQLLRHAMQILSILLLNDNGSTADYIHEHSLVKVLLMAVKDFNPDSGDSEYTVGIVDLLLECVELSYRTEAGYIILKEDIHNAHGYQFLVQFALKLSSQTHQNLQSVHLNPSEKLTADTSDLSYIMEGTANTDIFSPHLSSSICRLLDVLASLAQTAPLESSTSFSINSLKSTNNKAGGKMHDEALVKENAKVQDLEAIQMLQDIFLKCDNVEVQAEVVDRMFKIFSSHLDNYQLCQPLKMVPLLILNMPDFPPTLQERILKILEYAVTVINFVPEQELLSLCCLLQQAITSSLKCSILSFFIKILSFDHQYKKVLREIGLLEFLIDNLKQHKLVSDTDDQTKSFSCLEGSSKSFTKRLEDQDIIISSPRLLTESSMNFLVFEDGPSANIAWDCLASLLRNDKVNQSTFHSARGFAVIVPFLASDIHRSGALRLLSALILEDSDQKHPEALGMLIEILKSGMVGNMMGFEYKLTSDAKCDILGLLWRVFGVNSSTKRVFGESTGFSLLLTTLYSFKSVGKIDSQLYLANHMKEFTFLLRAMTIAVCNHDSNRMRLHTVISSQTFYDLLHESSLICVDWEEHVITLLLELAVEIVRPPASRLPVTALPSDEHGYHSYGLIDDIRSGRDRVHNASAVGVLFRFLSLFTPKTQLELLILIEKLSSMSLFNQENLTSVGCVGLLLDAINPLLMNPSPVLMHALQIVEVLGAYRLSTLELRMLVRYTLQMKSLNSGYYLVDTMEKLIQMKDTISENISLASFVEMDMSRSGHASIQTSLGGRTWPPASGYSFACWFQYQPKKIVQKEQSDDTYDNSQHIETYTGEGILRIFSVASAGDNKTVYVEFSLQDSGVLTLSTNNSFSVSFSGSKFEEGRWNHLAVVHSKPNSLTGLFESSVAYFYLNGRLRHTGKLDYFSSPVGKALQVTIGTPLACAKVSNVSWRLRSCYLFEEALTPSSIYFMYILGRGYRGIFQDKELLKFLPAQACNEDKMAILDGLDAESPSFSRTHRTESGNKRNEKSNELIWSLDRLAKLSLDLVGRKLIFAFDGTSTELLRSSGTPSLLNLVDPEAAAASPFGGIPRFGLLSGDSYICHQYVIGNSIRAVGGIIVILALIEAAETRDMLHMALTLLASALHQNPQNVVDMLDCRGYHLLAIFLHRRMSLFDMQSLDIFLQIAACEAFIPESEISERVRSSPSVRSAETSFDYNNLQNFSDEDLSGGISENMNLSSVHKDSVSLISEPQRAYQNQEFSKFSVLSNVDMVEHVLLDWTLWATAPISIQLALIGFFEQLVSFQLYRNHNLALLRKINLIQYLLIVMQRDDMEIQVLEKLVLLLSVILEDGFVASELSLILRFVMMTFDPLESITASQNVQEAMEKKVIVRNLLLEMLIDLQLTITSEELLEKWYEILSLKFITYFLDNYVHPTSMTWIMTLLGVCFAASPTFDVEFQSIGGYQTLQHVLSSYCNSPDIYYILFCLVFGKPVYPRTPDVLTKHFHSLIQSDGNYEDLKYVQLLDSVIAMAKSAFDKLSLASTLTESINLSHFNGKNKTVEAEYSHGEEQGSMKLENGEKEAPATATFVLRFMVDLAKICPPFSNICRRAEILESSVDLYFSCARAVCIGKMTMALSTDEPEGSLNDSCSSLKTQFARSVSFQGHEEETMTTESVTQGISSSFSEGETTVVLNSSLDNNQIDTRNQDLTELDGSSAGGRATPESIQQTTSEVPDVNNLPKQSSSSAISTPSPMIVLASWLGSKVNKREVSSQPSPIVGSFAYEGKASPKPSTSSYDFPTIDKSVHINPETLVEIERQGNDFLYSSAANAVLDFVSLVLADILSEHLNGCSFVESILELVPLYIDVESALAFQGLCLSRVMNFLERRLLQEDEDNEKKLDKGIWSANLGALCWLVVDRVYMGAFSQPAGVLRTLEFLLSMLQMSNKNGCIENALPSGKGFLSLSKGSRQLDAYVRALLKNTNRMVMYCFMPSFLESVGENDFLSRLGFLTQHREGMLMKTIQADTSIDIATVLQLLYAHKHLVLCRSNLDTDLISCLCVNLIYLLRDKRRSVENFSVDILKYMLLYRHAALEELLSANSYQGQYLNVLDGGFDKLITRNASAFFDWFNASKEIIDKALEHCAALMWTQYIGGSSKFLSVRKKGMEDRLDKHRGVKSQEASNSYSRHQELTKVNRKDLKIIRDSMSTKLRVIRQNKYGWILHAESEWQNHLQHLVHERGIIPMCNSDLNIEWKISLIEGPYRMRKKLERCNSRVDKLEVYLKANSEVTDKNIAEEKRENASVASRSNPDPVFSLPFGGTNKGERDDGESGEESFLEVDDYGGDEATSLQASWNDDQVSLIDETSPHSTHAFGVESSAFSGQASESMHRSSVKKSPDSEAKKVEEISEKISADNGEYLIRPYLEPLEKIRNKYNCERVSGLDKRDGIFLIGDLCLYVIENFYIDELGCICEKQSEEELSIIDQALGVKEDITGSSETQSKPPSVWGEAVKALVGGRAWALNGGRWDKERVHSNANLPHPWHMWKLDSVHELLKRDYQLRPVAIEIFSLDGCNNLLVFHKRERDEVFKSLLSMNLPRSNILDVTKYGLPKHDSNENGRLFKGVANTFTKRWQNGEVSNFQYLMHLNTLAGRGYNDLTQYPVFPWVLADYESETLDLENPKTFRKFDKPIGCQTKEGEEEFKNRYELWDDPEVPKFHYGSHYSSAGIVLFYLLRLPPFSTENQRLQGGQFDRADRLFCNIGETWSSAIDKGNTSDVKELIPEFFYLPEFLENRFNLNLGEKQTGEKVDDVVLPPWAKGSAREFIKKHRDALECDYVSENLHHWIDLIFGYKQRGKAAEEAVNVFYYYTYEGSVDIDSVADPVMKSSILAQINHFGQTPRQLFSKPHVKRRTDVKRPANPLISYSDLIPHEIRKSSSAISQIISFHDKVLVAGENKLLKPVTYSECIVWGFPDCSLRFMSYDNKKIISTHEGLHGGNQIEFAGISLDGQILATGSDDGVVAVWQIYKDQPRGRHNLRLQRALCAHTARITRLYVSQPYSVIVTGSEDCTVILWDLTGLTFVKELAVFPEPVSAIHVNDLTGEIYTAAGILLAVWSINGDCLAITNTSQLPSDSILCIATSTFSDWQYTDWLVTGHQSGAVKIWNLVHCSTHDISNNSDNSSNEEAGRIVQGRAPEYRLVLKRVLKSHKHPVTALHLTSDLRQLLSGDSAGELLSWTLPEEALTTPRPRVGFLNLV